MILLWSRPVSIVASLMLHSILTASMLIAFNNPDNLETLTESDSATVEVVVVSDEETSTMEVDTNNAEIAERAEDEGYNRGEPTPRQAAYSPPPPPAPAPEPVPEPPDQLENIAELVTAIPDEIASNIQEIVQQPPSPSEPPKSDVVPLPANQRIQRLKTLRKNLNGNETKADTKITEQDSNTKKTLDLKNIAAVLNQIPDVIPSGSDQAVGEKRKRPKPGEESEVNGFDATLTRAERDFFESQVSSCWNWNLPFTSVAGEDELTVTLSVSLDRQGNVVGKPVWKNSSNGPIKRLAAESAARAIIKCAPYKLPSNKYDNWSKVEMNFNPEDMLQ